MRTTSEAANREGINIDTVSHSLQMPLLLVMIPLYIMSRALGPAQFFN
jgi:hypothetical protein